jgi:hypothetical protein
MPSPRRLARLLTLPVALAAVLEVAEPPRLCPATGGSHALAPNWPHNCGTHGLA